MLFEIQQNEMIYLKTSHQTHKMNHHNKLEIAQGASYTSINTVIKINQTLTEKLMTCHKVVTKGYFVVLE